MTEQSDTTGGVWQWIKRKEADAVRNPPKPAVLGWVYGVAATCFLFVALLAFLMVQ